MMRRSEEQGLSRRGKKMNSETKPKQPQRGLGVAQLEKIRIQSQMISAADHNLPASFPTYNLTMEEDTKFPMPFSPSSPSSSFGSSSSSFSVHPHVWLGCGESSNADFRFAKPQSYFSIISSFSEPVHQGPITLQLLEESSQNRTRHGKGYSLGPVSQNSDSTDSQEPDLELRL